MTTPEGAPTRMTDDIVANRLRERMFQDHKRGCAGRCYACTCGYDDEWDGLLERASVHIDTLRAALSLAVGERDRAREALERTESEIVKGMTDHEGETVPSHWRGLCELFFPTANDAAAFAKFVAQLRDLKSTPAPLNADTGKE